MAVHDLGYRGWNGPRTGATQRWIVVAATGVRRAWHSRWLRRMVFFSWMPAILFGGAFFLWEQALLHRDLAEPLGAFVRGAPQEIRDIALEGFRAEDPASARHSMWSWLLQSFFRNPQGVVMVLVIGIIAPPLISQDIRSRAFVLYFSRPLTRFEYVLGKLATIWFFLAVIATLPALSLYLLGILLSPHWNVVAATWDLPFRIIAASVVLALPTASLALFLSSMTQESRIAGFAWFAIWILGAVTYGIMTSADAINARDPDALDVHRWANCSLYHALGRVQSWIFGFAEFQDIQFSAYLVIAITVVATALLLRRVTAPMRA